jgi:polyhydroxybutyrate depolymerase
MLAYRLACDTDIFAAIGPISATMLGQCLRPAPASVIHIHGVQDRTIPYQGGPGKRSNDGTGPRPADTDGPPIPALIAMWSAVDHCGEPEVKVTGVITRSTAICQDGRGVVLITISDAGHQWPGQPGPSGPAAKLLDLDPPSMALNATDAIWRFFSEHPRPAGSR